MKIKKNASTDTVPFGIMECGGVFSYAGFTYQRTEEFYNKDRVKRNAIRLADGCGAYLPDSMLVQAHPEAELHINA